jgi:hypothetical protein
MRIEEFIRNIVAIIITTFIYIMRNLRGNDSIKIDMKSV